MRLCEIIACCLCNPMGALQFYAHLHSFYNSVCFSVEASQCEIMQHKSQGMCHHCTSANHYLIRVNKLCIQRHQKHLDGNRYVVG